MSPNSTIAVVGTGIAGVAALLDTLVAIEVPVALSVFDAKSEKIPRGETAFPLGGRDARQIHPFFTDRPPADFPTFGEYAVARFGKPLPSPTRDQVADYLQHLIELAIGVAGELVT